MLTLRTAATASSTYTDQAPPITPVAAPVQKYTPADKPARSALYAARKDIGLQGIPRKNVIGLRKDLINGSTSSFWTTKERKQRSLLISQ